MPIVESYTIGCVPEFLAILDNLRADLKQKEAAGIPSDGHPTTFRGQTNCKPLIPSLARLRPGADMLHYEEKVLLELQRCLPSPAAGLWEVAVIGRHHGLPTRFLDWSESPLVGLFFGVEESLERATTPGFVFGTHHKRTFLADRKEAAPWKLSERIFLLPPLATPSVQTQLSVLSAWPEPERPFDERYPVWRFEIPAEKRGSIPARTRPSRRQPGGALSRSHGSVQPPRMEDVDGASSVSRLAARLRCSPRRATSGARDPSRCRSHPSAAHHARVHHGDS